MAGGRGVALSSCCLSGSMMSVLSVTDLIAEPGLVLSERFMHC